jgi:hypothetical protein
MLDLFVNGGLMWARAETNGFWIAHGVWCGMRTMCHFGKTGRGFPLSVVEKNLARTVEHCHEREARPDFDLALLVRGCRLDTRIPLDRIAEIAHEFKDLCSNHTTTTTVNNSVHIESTKTICRVVTRACTRQVDVRYPQGLKLGCVPRA